MIDWHLADWQKEWRIFFKQYHWIIKKWVQICVEKHVLKTNCSSKAVFFVTHNDFCILGFKRDWLILTASHSLRLRLQTCTSQPASWKHNFTHCIIHSINLTLEHERSFLKFLLLHSVSDSWERETVWGP